MNATLKDDYKAALVGVMSLKVFLGVTCVLLPFGGTQFLSPIPLTHNKNNNGFSSLSDPLANCINRFRNHEISNHFGAAGLLHEPREPQMTPFTRSALTQQPVSPIVNYRATKPAGTQHRNCRVCCFSVTGFR